jgi:hypothetical protein
MVVENVRGAQPWVGRAKANYGSYYLWGDVGMVGKRVVAGVLKFGVSLQPMKACKVPGFRFDGVSHGSFQTASVEAMKVPGLDDGVFPPGGLAQGYLDAQKRNPDGTSHGPGSWFAIADSKERGANSAFKSSGMNWSDQTLRGQDFTRVAGKQAEARKITDYSDPRRNGGRGVHLTSQREQVEGRKQEGSDGLCRESSKSNSRKAASALIAKIPYPLASYIARCFYPRSQT